MQHINEKNLTKKYRLFAACSDFSFIQLSKTRVVIKITFCGILSILGEENLNSKSNQKLMKLLQNSGSLWYNDHTKKNGKG